MANREDAPAPEMGADGRSQTAPTVEELQQQLETERAEKERIKQSLKKTSDEDARKRRRLEELEKAEEERQAATLGEADRLRRDRAADSARAEGAERRAAQAEAELVRVRVDQQIERLARDHKFIYPDVVANLIDRSAIEYDEDDPGKPLNLRDLIKRIADERPALVESPPRGGTPPRGNPAMRGNGSNDAGNGDRPAAVNPELELRRKVRYSM